MGTGSGTGRKKKVIGLLITMTSFAVGASSAYSGQTYLISVVLGIGAGLIAATGYNLFAKMSGTWPVLNFSDVVSWIFICDFPKTKITTKGFAY
jgi:hypothetical protein